ncbi:DUF4349 domain-containing protein [Flavobacterium sp. SUN052]|uniref:DUF4349 domain-containing protein n=1 Tax=Flavobacterium sp. SUN052 TaxID=3002441 RepID=UPI00237ED106|nr:DUF4349 domain-containing protein [Flavobacterium sp. SUN052]MEC4003614.1 DUF4349 domain-containing protein [Flavobacterium sp. SUN052]
MKKNTKFVVALLLIGIAISCKQAQSENAEATLDKTEVSAADSTAVISSSAVVQPKKSNRKFVRTADIKFKVKNVYKSTGIVEDATNKFGGFVTYTNLQSPISDEDKTKISPDSTLVSTKYTVQNNITIRVPNTQLDTVVKTIAHQIGFLNYRVIKADDVTLQMLSNKMAQKRSTSTENRIANDIDSKGKKLNQVLDAEENLAAKKEANDSKTLENLSLNDQVNFSTLTLQIYQDETVKQEMIANQKSINAYRPNIGLQVWDSIKTGWFVLENIISFVVLLWPFALLGFLGFLGYKKFLKK